MEFATIVGLLCNFMAERRAGSDDDYKEFIEWLNAKRHNDIVELISSNAQLGLRVKSLLSENHDQVMGKLTWLCDAMSVLSSQVSGLKDIVEITSPNISISPQSVSILRQLVNSGSSAFMEIKMAGSAVYQTIDGDVKWIDVEEPRFIDDDLNTLCSLGLLSHRLGSKSSSVYGITRAAVAYVEQLE